MERATTVPPKGLWNIRWFDVLKSLYYACVTQIVALVVFLFASLLQEHPHFPTWAEWLPYIRATVYAMGGYIAGKLGINNVGQILQKDKPVVHVDAVELDTLQQKADELEQVKKKINKLFFKHKNTTHEKFRCSRASNFSLTYSRHTACCRLLAGHP